jgi:hypothetical protein
MVVWATGIELVLQNSVEAIYFYKIIRNIKIRASRVLLCTDASSERAGHAVRQSNGHAVEDEEVQHERCVVHIMLG